MFTLEGQCQFVCIGQSVTGVVQRPLASPASEDPCLVKIADNIPIEDANIIQICLINNYLSMIDLFMKERRHLVYEY